MPEPTTPSSNSNSNPFVPELPLLPNGAVDLYAVIETPAEAGEARIRMRVGELYSEALANADHKDIRKRHYYDNLLDLLPRCYDILLDEDKRPIYDEYRRLALTGQPVPEFEAYIIEAAPKAAEEGDGLLEIRPSGLLEARPTVDVTTAALRPEAMQDGEKVATKPRISASLIPLLALVAFIVTLVVLRGVLRQSFPVAVGAGLGAAQVAAVLLKIAINNRSR